MACAAIETFTVNLATELGPRGVRVVCLQTAAVEETFRSWPEDHREHAFDDPEKPWKGEGSGPGMDREEFLATVKSKMMLRRLPTLADVANAATFLASDRAGAVTATLPRDLRHRRQLIRSQLPLAAGKGLFWKPRSENGDAVPVHVHGIGRGVRTSP